VKRWYKIGIGIGLACVAIVALVVWGPNAAQRFFYPFAPPMPAGVGEAMPDILARLEAALKTNAPSVLAGLQPGLAAGDIARLEQQYRIQLPDDLRALYAWHDGARQPTNTAACDFIPIHRFLPLEEALADRAAFAPNQLPPVQWVAYRFLAKHREPWLWVFSDGARDGYWFDPTLKPPDGAVFYTFTEDGTFIFFPSFKNVMAGVTKCYEQEIYRVKPGTAPSQLDEDFEKSAKVWTEFGASNQP